MPRFNIALLPSDENLQASLTKLAQSYFSKSQDGYILGNEALAHVTLCQFYAEDERKALEIYNAHNYSAPIGLAIEKFRLRPGDGIHVGKFWAELLIRKTVDLLEYQRKCFQNLVQHEIAPLTPVETYSPHITLARLSNENTQLPSQTEIPAGPLLFQPTVGSSTENGVLINTLSKSIR